MTTSSTLVKTSADLVLKGDTTDQYVAMMESKVLVNDQVRIIMQGILYGIILTLISGFGVGSNIINIICFLRQGLTDPINVSLLGLAISDLGSLTGSFFIGLGYNPVLQQALDLPVDWLDVLYITVALPRIVFTGLTSWITCLITVERCLCITVPLKVKNIISSRRVMVIIVCIFILLTCSVSPMYYVSELSWVFSPERNRSILRLVYTDNKAVVEQFSYSVNNAFIPFSAYFIIIACTIILVGKLRDKAKWRLAVTASISADNTSKRDQRVAKMVMRISMLFIGCFTPMCFLFISMIAVPDLALHGPNQNVLYIFGGFSIVLESANSSANIFIYYHMSSRYRAVFRSLFLSGKADGEQGNAGREN